jgi:hypothetical protein
MGSLVNSPVSEWSSPRNYREAKLNLFYGEGRAQLAWTVAGSAAQETMQGMWWRCAPPAGAGGAVRPGRDHTCPCATRSSQRTRAPFTWLTPPPMAIGRVYRR